MTRWLVRLLGAAFALGLTACATAQTPDEPVQPALWVVRDADSTLYLYGTIHIRKPGDPWGGPAAERALAASDEVWTEIEIDPQRAMDLQQHVMRMGFDPQRPLSSRLSPERAAQLRAAAARLNMAPDAFDLMKPWLAGITLSVVPLVQAGYDPQAGVEQSIDRIGEAAGKRMRWFETAEEQLGFFDSMSAALQLQLLEESLDELDATVETLQAQEAAWWRGDDAALDSELNMPMKKDYPELFEVILRRRNAAWTETLARELAGAGTDFVAVGAAHLAGDDGVPAMLRAKGFTVERVTPRP